MRVRSLSYKKCVDDGKRKPAEMWPVSEVFRLVEEIRGKVSQKEK